MADVMLVGHCGPDAIMLRTVVQRAMPGASVELVNDHEALDAALERDVVLLVNRELDGEFTTGRGGIDLIRHLGESSAKAPMLLVSNFEDAQAQAEAAGAMPGFGKSDLYDEATTQRLMDAASRCG
ncbi:MAG: response regulator [Phycisphaerae bacterium]|jgi:hypothetical protein|nr:response regulator [Phycisphaerae bacterium]|tara:strand:+ start:6070 stop:6447 length:378 start_codon:yes stop_codon:yes gene_type:complete